MLIRSSWLFTCILAGSLSSIQAYIKDRNSLLQVCIQEKCWPGNLSPDCIECKKICILESPEFAASCMQQQCKNRCFKSEIAEADRRTRVKIGRCKKQCFQDFNDLESETAKKAVKANIKVAKTAFPFALELGVNQCIYEKCWTEEFYSTTCLNCKQQCYNSEKKIIDSSCLRAKGCYSGIKSRNQQCSKSQSQRSADQAAEFKAATQNCKHQCWSDTLVNYFEDFKYWKKTCDKKCPECEESGALKLPWLSSADKRAKSSQEKSMPCRRCINKKCRDIYS